jgi:hypothetical protein
MMKNSSICILLVVIMLMAAGCGKIRTCYCMDYGYYDIIDTALFESFTVITFEDSLAYVRESAMDCSFWGMQDTLAQDMPEYGIRRYYVFECHEK